MDNDLISNQSNCQKRMQERTQLPKIDIIKVKDYRILKQLLFVMFAKILHPHQS